MPPLDKSEVFIFFADKLTIKDEKDYFRYIKEPLPQGIELGNYSAYCFLDRGASHIAVVLIKTLKAFPYPKWLIFVNLLFGFLLSIILTFYFFDIIIYL